MNIVQRLESYLKEVLDVAVTAQEWDAGSRLPFYLRESYAFHEIRLLDTPCLLVVSREDEERTPATVRKHVEQVRAKWEGEVVFVVPAVSSYNRKRLIEQKVAFVVPGNQMYLPPLGIDLREHFRKIRTGTQTFSPSTQTVVLNVLLCPEEQEYTPSGLADELDYTAMTMTRAFDELESAGLGEVATEGRERRLRFGESKKEIWRKAQEYLRDPVKKRLWAEPLRSSWQAPAAGLTALAHYSLLAAPPNPVVAMSTEGWKIARQRKELRELPHASSESVEVELWYYDPQLFATDGVVDRLSLYLSLREMQDERVEAALDEMMEAFPW